MLANYESEIKLFFDFNNLKIDLLYKCVGISGLNGLDQLFSFMIASQMKTISKLIRKELTNKETK